MIDSSDTASAGEYINVTWSTGRTPGATDNSGEIAQVQDYVDGLTTMYPVSSVSVVGGDTIGLNATLWYASVTLRIAQSSDGLLYGDLLQPLQSFWKLSDYIIPVNWSLEDAEYTNSSNDNSGAAVASTANSPATQIQSAANVVKQAASGTTGALEAIAILALVGLSFYVLAQTGVLRLFNKAA